MATLKVEIVPFEVPEEVEVRVGEELVRVPLLDLDEETINALLEEFATAVTEKASK